MKRILQIFLVIFVGILVIPDPVVAQSADANQRLLDAASEGDQTALLRALRDSAYVNTATDEGVTALMYAAQRGDLEMVDILLYNGADPRLKPQNGYDALMSAAAAGFLEVAEKLVRGGADVNASDENGVTPLMYAAAYNQWYLCDMLLFYQAKISQKDHDSLNALMAAAWAGNSAIAGLLINKGASTADADEHGATPLWYALKKEQAAVVDTLLDLGADPNVRRPDHKALTPLFYAKYHRDMEDYRRIKKAGGRINGLPYVSEWLLNVDLADFNGGDYLCGLGTGIFEAKSASSLTVGFTTRLTKNRILYPVNDQYYYQLREGRGTIYLQAQKMLRLPWGNVRFHYGPFVGGRILYTFGRYEGMDMRVDDRWLFSPQAGLALISDAVDYRLWYNYQDFGTTQLSPHRVGISVIFHINIRPDKSLNSIFWIN